VVEATASYEWLWQLLEPLANRLVLAHPKKLRVIAESVRKTDALDAEVLARFLALGMIPEAYRPTPRQRQHRVLVRHRSFLRRRTSAVKNRLHHILANYNADRRDLFSQEGLVHLKQVALKPADRFVAKQLVKDLKHLDKQLRQLDRHLRAFAKKAPLVEQEAREVLSSIPYVGPVTVDVVVSELGDIRRFRSAKRVAAYAGLAPGRRESAGHSKELGITKEGSRLLRWALVESSWRLATHSRRWQRIFANLALRRGKKRAVVAVARRLLTVMVALLRSGKRYRLAE
jgi:transposase